MDDQREQHSVEHDIDDLKQSLHRYIEEAAHPNREFVPDLTNAIDRIGDHVVALHRRLERLEATEDEWTTRGWEPPPGVDRQPRSAL